MFFSNEKIIEDVSDILSLLPLNSWKGIVKKEPEYSFLQLLNKKYSFSRQVLVTMIVGLNDYQLKCRAEVCYWPRLYKLFNDNPLRSGEEMINALKDFYRQELSSSDKLKRIDKLLASPLYRTVKSSHFNEGWLEKNFTYTWKMLAFAMRQKPWKKTIVFTMKILGILLIIRGYTGFNFSGIPVPVDSRVRRLTVLLTGDPKLSDREIRLIWNKVLGKLKEKHNEITMIHLDSLLWQIGAKDMNEMKVKRYFDELGEPFIGEKLSRIIAKNLWMVKKYEL